jgi:hypothetical protein
MERASDLSMNFTATIPSGLTPQFSDAGPVSTGEDFWAAARSGSSP